MPINLTPERFLQLVILGLYWEHGELVQYRTVNNNIAYRNGFTTVDHILKIFRTLEVVTDSQIKKLIQHRVLGKIHQQHLLRYTGRTSGGHRVEDNLSLLRIREKDAFHGKVNLITLVTSKQIEITFLGKERAKACEHELYPFNVDRDIYCRKSAEIETGFKTEAASASASRYYRERVRKLLSLEEK